MSKSVLDRMKNLLSTAHKFILKLASEVFVTMFRFDAKNEKVEFASANCPVEVIDVEAAAFKMMLSFIYTGELSELNGDNAMAVLYAAKKYNIPDLVDASLHVPVSSLRNVFLAYALAKLYQLEGFANDCLAYIDKNADTLLKSEEFLQIDQKLLCEIFGRDELQISGEISIWKAQRIAVKCLAQHCSKFAFRSSQKRSFHKKLELMDPCNGLYEKKEDKVTLAIDVTLKEAKMADNS
ncbi:hypothetical protein niasHT_003344 [Heterodera trifolii]|uniref:BTB domain-containing protein n=1 Tax=Heterodera trifolii TaxID=157864 RepID=A0ABD2LXX5_9BILA